MFSWTAESYKLLHLGGILRKELLTIALLFILGGLANAAPVTIHFTSLPNGTAVTNPYPVVTFSLMGGVAVGPPVTGLISGPGGLSNSRFR